MQVEPLNEIEIAEERPRVVRIGRRRILVRQMTLRELMVFSEHFSRFFLRHKPALVGLFEIIRTWDAKTPREEVAVQLAVMMEFREFRQDLSILLRRTFPSLGRRWFFFPSYLERHLTPTALMELFEAFYGVNFGEIKKKAQSLASRTGWDFFTGPSSSRPPLDGPSANILRPRFTRLAPTPASGQSSSDPGKNPAVNGNSAASEVSRT